MFIKHVIILLLSHFSGEESHFVNKFLFFHLLKFIFFIFLFYFLSIFLFFHFYFHSLIIFFREDMENAIRKLDDTEFKNPYDSTFIRVKSAKGGAREYVTSYHLLFTFLIIYSFKLKYSYFTSIIFCLVSLTLYPLNLKYLYLY